MSNVISLFPQPVMITKNIDQHDEIPNFENELNDGNTSTKSKNVLEYLPNLSKIIQDNIDQYVANIIKPKTLVNFYVTHSWINYTETGQFHHMHDHPNSIISGVYYIQANPDYDNIVFHNPQSNQPCIKLEQEFNLFNSETWWLPVATGDLILFPSTFKHEVPNSVNPDLRISLAFNVFVRGEIGLPNNTDRFII